ncbi:vesicle coat component [Coemansia sp. RSA 2322]|nr:vesicle coat component [Coemansia sp. RSA 2322]KAJ2484517.1 vesicle coat component [Coemansia sp. RSA 2320]
MKAVFLALAILAAVLGLCTALEFDLPATPEIGGGRRCLSQWLPHGTHVRVKSKVLPGFPGQKINMEIHDDSPSVNQYGARRAVDEVTFRFDTQAHANVIVCFQNVLEANFPNDGRVLTVQFKMESGAMAEDFHKLQQEEKLKPMEVELRRLAMTLDDVQDELQYLKHREGSLRDANERMNGRVKTFTFFSIAVLIGVAVYQVLYLRRFFQQKKLI